MSTIFIPTKLGVVIMDHHVMVRFNLFGKIRTNQGTRKINVTVNVKGKTHHLHRYIKQVKSKKLIVDHRNGNRLDCRDSNLRITTILHNNKNLANIKRKNGLPRGVSPYGKRFLAKIHCEFVLYNLGIWDDVEGAELAYIDAHNFLFHKHSRHNDVPAIHS